MTTHPIVTALHSLPGCHTLKPMTRYGFWTMALGSSAAIALALKFVLAVLGTPSSPSVFTSFAVAITYALAIGVPSALILPPMMSAVQGGHPLFQASLGI